MYNSIQHFNEFGVKTIEKMVSVTKHNKRV